MIKYDLKNINDWNFGGSNVTKVYRNGAIVYYKISGEGPTPEYQVCFAVVDDISQYSDREFEDVYDKATDKWYKLNNLNQYEQYGIYGSGRTICEGSTSRLPQGYTEVEYVENTSTAYIDTGAYLNTSNFEIGYTIGNKQQLFGYCHQGCENCTWLGVEQSATMWWGNFNNNASISSYLTSSENTIIFTQSGATINGNNISKTLSIGSDSIANTPLMIFARYNFNGNTIEHRTDSYMQLKSFYLKNNGTLVRDFVPVKRDSDGKYGLFDIVNNVFYLSPNNVDFSGGEPITPTDCITTYKGKLTIDDGYEYEWNGSSWVNLGEVSGSSIPDNYVIPFEDSNVKAICVNNWGGNVVAGELTYGEAKQVTSLGSVFKNNNSITSFNELVYFKGLTRLDNGEFAGCRNLTDIVIPNNVRYLGYDSASRATFSGCTNLSGVTMISGGDSLTTELTANNGSYYMSSSHENVPMVFPDREITMSGSTFGYYDYLANVYFQSSTPPTNLANADINNYRKLANVYCPVGSLSAYEAALTGKGKTIREYDFETDSLGLLDKEKEWASKTGTQTEYPKYYTEKSDPLDDLTFNTLDEAQTYAYNNCVYDGMKATIDGDRYYFDSSDENGWVKILEYYKVEDVTPNAASGWTISGSSTYNPDSSYYDDFDLETSWTNTSYKIAKVTIYGYDHFTYYLRSYHSWTSAYGYVMATDVDEISTPPSAMSYKSSSAIANTYYFSKTPKSAVNLSNYRRVTYNNLDKTVEHTFYVYFCGITYGSYVGNATILIPKEQTNENWEQVTFSASSNVASAQKSLYIDNNNSTSGGTQYWYYRWIIGLPSGSHSSYVNCTSYNYCPNVTSSTFTSVEGEKRQVNFTYDNTTNKTLSFRLTDGSNVLTPSNTVYYNMTYYNSCGISTSSNNVTFPRSQSVKVGGRFRFTNSSNRHYIYGYSPNISLNYDYYVDNYLDTFDITYTKLNDEAVTITYTTYDPSDTEVPAFNTKITYPYSGETTSATTLTSFNVPYTYPYEVAQTNSKFSADTQSYTANQSARAISFTLYPNNREFTTVADLEAYQYAWEGMKAKVGDTNYKYENGEWVESGGELPDVPFTVNYNAKQYNTSTKTLLKTEGQLADVDAVITAGTPTVHDGYLTIATGTRATISGYQNYFNRDNNNPNLTIISKQRTDGTNGHMFANRDSNAYNWMYRCYNNKLTLHGSGEQGFVAVTTQPVIESVRIDSNSLATYNNYTNNTSSTYSNFNYGDINNGGFALFAGYAQNTGEWFAGDFYWIYMCQGTLTDEQVQQVIDYNENLW